MAHNQQFGGRGEDAACQWYQLAGYDILERNWRSRQGEIDLIVARDRGAQRVVAFVEVKARSSTRFGSGAEAVGRSKQATIRSVARSWLAEQNGYVPNLRFDVVDVDAAGTVAVYQGCF